MTAVPVDYSHLEIQAAGERDVMREVLKLFVTHGEQLIDELEDTLIKLQGHVA